MKPWLRVGLLVCILMVGLDTDVSGERWQDETRSYGLGDSVQQMSESGYVIPGNAYSYGVSHTGVQDGAIHLAEAASTIMIASTQSAGGEHLADGKMSCRATSSGVDLRFRGSRGDYWYLDVPMGYQLIYFVMEPRTFLQFPADPGKMWEAVVYHSMQSGARWKSVSTVEDTAEAVQVQGGTFKECLKVRTEISFDPTYYTPPDKGTGVEGTSYVWEQLDQSVQGIRYVWLARGVGLVKMRYEHLDGSVTEAELVTYSIPETSADWFPLIGNTTWTYEWNNTKSVGRVAQETWTIFPSDLSYVAYVYPMGDVLVHYIISFPDLGSRQIHVECQVENFPGGDLALRMTEDWAGAKHLFGNVRDLHAEDAGGHALKVDVAYTTAAIRDIPPGDFRYMYILQTKQEKLMSIAEEEPTLNDDYCFVFGHALFLHPDRIDQSKLRFQVDFDLPVGWNIATSWGNDAVSYRPESLDVLRGSEMALGDYRIYTKDVMGRPFTLAIRDQWPFTDQEYFNTVTGYARYYADLFGGFPEPYFLIICNKGLPDRGGGDAVTRTISVALLDLGLDASAKTAYLSDSVIPHELFHIWNGRAMSAADYGEGYWFHEGVTNYYALVTAYRFLPRRSEQETRDAQEFLEHGLSKFTNYYNRYPYARLDQVGYQAYTKGALVALILDAEIRRGSGGMRCLDDLMRVMYDRFGSENADGYTNQDIFDIASEQAGTDLHWIYDQYIIGTDRLPLDEYLDGFRVLMAELSGGTTGVEEEATMHLPNLFVLLQNHPNPFNTETMIRYALSEPVRVRLVVYDMLGQRVRTLVDRGQTAGQYPVIWDGEDGEGELVSSGVYFYRLEADEEYRGVRRMLLLR